MPAKFPRRRPDGSFSLNLRFASNGHADSQEVIDQWLSKWASSNDKWIRKWQSGHPLSVVETEVLEFSAAYVRAPRLAERSERSITIRLDSTPEAVYWKDWYAKLVLDFIVAFPQFSQDGVTNAD